MQARLQGLLGAPLAEQWGGAASRTLDHYIEAQVHGTA